MTVDAAADHVERNYGAATEYERALQELVDDLRKRVYSLEQQQPTPVAPVDLYAGRDELLDSWGLEDPDVVGQSEYRAVYSALAEIVSSQEVTGSDLIQSAITSLDEIVRSALAMREKLLSVDC